MNTIYYFFRRPILNEVRLAKIGKYPYDYFYGFNQLSSYKTIAYDLAENNKFIKILHILTNKFISKQLGLSFSIFPTLLQLTRLSKAQYIFTTVDSYGVALAFIKKIGLIKKQKLVFNTIGLCDVLVENTKLIPFYSKLLSNVDLFISGASLTESNKLSKLLGFSNEKFKFIPFGIDTTYFSPLKVKEDNYILVIGADRKRDWNLYRKLFLAFPNNQFVVITHTNLIAYSLPKNVRAYYNLSISKIKTFIAKSKFGVILSLQNYHFAGQSTAFRMMSMKKSVIFTKSIGVDEYNFKSGDECFLVNPGDFNSLKKAFILLDKNTKLRHNIGILARNKILKNLSVTRYSRILEKALNSL